MNIDTALLSRVTLVDDDHNPPRVYERKDIFVTLSVQDEGRTLKVFVNRSKSQKKRQDIQVGSE